MNVTANAETGTYTAEFTAREMRTLRNRTKVGASYGQTCAAIHQALTSVELPEEPAAPTTPPKVKIVLTTIGHLEEGDTFLHAGVSFTISAMDDHHCEGDSVVLFDKDGGAVEYERATSVTKLVFA